MARTIQEIEAAITAEMGTYASLAQFLPFASQTSLVRLIVYVVSFAIWLHETLWDKREKELQVAARDAITGTPFWYQQQAYLFQYGDTLTYFDDHYGYAVIDDSKKVVKLASLRESEGTLRLKLAKLSAGVPGALTGPELAAFVSYINQVKFAGTFIACTSLAADDLLIEAATIYYDPIVPLATVKAAVASAIEAYIRSLPFDGALSIDRLEDAIQGVTGVKEVVLSTVKARYGANPYTTVISTYVADAGYLALVVTSAIFDDANYQPYHV